MQNSDEAIDRVLTGLRNTEAPEGLNRRIHHSLQANALAHREHAPRRTLRSLLSAPVLAIATAAAIVLISAICWNSARKAPGASPHVTAQHKPVPQFSPAPPTLPAIAQTVQPVRKVTAPKPPTSHPSNPNQIQEASYPAPEAPLTDQEHLLLRLAHGADLKTLEAYSPAQNEAHLAQEKAQFQQFFDPPTTVNNE